MKKFRIVECEEGWWVESEEDGDRRLFDTGFGARAELMRESALRADANGGRDVISIEWNPTTRTGRAVVTVLTSEMSK